MNRRDGQFATTRWSLVLAAGGDRSAPEVKSALTLLCEAYWYPLYAEARRRGLSADDASDRTQAFFARLIERGDLAPEAIITHRMSLEQAVEGYKIFDKKQEDCRKVILTPGRSEPLIPERLEEPLAAPLGQAGVV